MRQMAVLVLLLWSITSLGDDKKDLIPKVYGKINISYGLEDINSADSWQMKSNASRIGVKGSYPLTEGLKAVYLLEWEVDVTDNANSSSDHIKARNQYAGVEGSFGAVLLGRNDSPIKLAQGKFDLFNDLDGDIKTLTASELRVDNVLVYTSPKLGDLAQIMVAAIPGEEPGGQDGPADALSGNIIFTKNGLFGSVGVMDSDALTYLRGVLYYNTKQYQIGGLLEKDEIGDSSETAFALSGSYTSGKATFKAQFGNSDIGPKGKGLSSASYQGTESLSVGIDYSLHKNTLLYVYYTGMDDDGNHKADYIKVGGEVKF